MNAFGDDYVSFVPMHLTFSPDGQFILVSTGKIAVQNTIMPQLFIIFVGMKRSRQAYIVLLG